MAGMGVAKAPPVPVHAVGNSQLVSGCCDDPCELFWEESSVVQNSGFTPFRAGLRKKESVFVVG